MGKVVINGKVFNVTSANEVFKANTDEELTNHFEGQNSVDAKWTRHIKEINEQLKGVTYKAGRPKVVEPVENQPGM